MPLFLFIIPIEINEPQLIAHLCLLPAQVHRLLMNPPTKAHPLSYPSLLPFQPSSPNSLNLPREGLDTTEMRGTLHDDHLRSTKFQGDSGHKGKVSRKMTWPKEKNKDRNACTQNVVADTISENNKNEARLLFNSAKYDSFPEKFEVAGTSELKEVTTRLPAATTRIEKKISLRDRCKSPSAKPAKESSRHQTLGLTKSPSQVVLQDYKTAPLSGHMHQSPKSSSVLSKIHSQKECSHHKQRAVTSSTFLHRASSKSSSSMSSYTDSRRHLKGPSNLCSGQTPRTSTPLDRSSGGSRTAQKLQFEEVGLESLEGESKESGFGESSLPSQSMSRHALGVCPAEKHPPHEAKLSVDQQGDCSICQERFPMSNEKRQPHSETPFQHHISTSELGYSTVEGFTSGSQHSSPAGVVESSLVPSKDASTFTITESSTQTVTEAGTQTPLLALKSRKVPRSVNTSSVCSLASVHGNAETPLSQSKGTKMLRNPCQPISVETVPSSTNKQSLVSFPPKDTTMSTKVTEPATSTLITTNTGVQTAFLSVSKATHMSTKKLANSVSTQTIVNVTTQTPVQSISKSTQVSRNRSPPSVATQTIADATTQTLAQSMSKGTQMKRTKSSPLSTSQIIVTSPTKTGVLSMSKETQTARLKSAPDATQIITDSTALAARQFISKNTQVFNKHIKAEMPKTEATQTQTSLQPQVKDTRKSEQSRRNETYTHQSVDAKDPVIARNQIHRTDDSGVSSMQILKSRTKTNAEGEVGCTSSEKSTGSKKSEIIRSLIDQVKEISTELKKQSSSQTFEYEEGSSSAPFLHHKHGDQWEAKEFQRTLAHSPPYMPYKHGSRPKSQDIQSSHGSCADSLPQMSQKHGRRLEIQDKRHHRSSSESHVSRRHVGKAESWDFQRYHGSPAYSPPLMSHNSCGRWQSQDFQRNPKSSDWPQHISHEYVDSWESQDLQRNNGSPGISPPHASHGGRWESHGHERNHNCLTDSQPRRIATIYIQSLHPKYREDSNHLGAHLDSMSFFSEGCDSPVHDRGYIVGGPDFSEIGPFNDNTPSRHHIMSAQADGFMMSQAGSPMPAPCQDHMASTAPRNMSSFPYDTIVTSPPHSHRDISYHGQGSVLPHGPIATPLVSVMTGPASNHADLPAGYQMEGPFTGYWPNQHGGGIHAAPQTQWIPSGEGPTTTSLLIKNGATSQNLPTASNSAPVPAPAPAPHMALSPMPNVSPVPLSTQPTRTYFHHLNAPDISRRVEGHARESGERLKLKGYHDRVNKSMMRVENEMRKLNVMSKRIRDNMNAN